MCAQSFSLLGQMRQEGPVRSPRRAQVFPSPAPTQETSSGQTRGGALRGIPPWGRLASYLHGLGNQDEAGHPCYHPHRRPSAHSARAHLPPDHILCLGCFQLVLLMAWAARFYPGALRIGSVGVSHVLKSCAGCVVIKTYILGGSWGAQPVK